MKRKFRLLKIILLLVTFIFLLNFTKKQNNHRRLLPFEINIVDSLDKKFITKDKVINILKEESNFELPEKMEDVSVDKIEKKLNQNPFIDSANVSLDINGKLMVFIKQKTPILRVNNPKEQFYLSESDEFIPLSDNFSYRCMIVDGDIKKEDISGLISLVSYINDDKMLKNHIIGIRKIENNSFNLLVNYGDYVVEFGGLENQMQKLENLKEFYRQFLSKTEENIYKKIVLKYNNQIIGIKKNKNEYSLVQSKK